MDWLDWNIRKRSLIHELMREFGSYYFPNFSKWLFKIYFLYVNFPSTDELIGRKQIICNFRFCTTEWSIWNAWKLIFLNWAISGNSIRAISLPPDWLSNSKWFIDKSTEWFHERRRLQFSVDKLLVLVVLASLEFFPFAQSLWIDNLNLPNNFEICIFFFTASYSCPQKLDIFYWWNF